MEAIRRKRNNASYRRATIFRVFGVCSDLHFLHSRHRFDLRFNSRFCESGIVLN